jgi:hypothetical protein
MNTLLKLSTLFAASATLATAVPATAAVSYNTNESTFVAPGAETFNDHRDWSRDRRYGRDDYRRGYNSGYRNDYRERNWRGNDRRYSCRRGSGTTGLILGGGAGALLGRSIDGGRDRTLGTILGAGAGALLGREVDRGGSRCR